MEKRTYKYTVAVHRDGSHVAYRLGQEYCDAMSACSQCPRRISRQEEGKTPVQCTLTQKVGGRRVTNVSMFFSGTDGYDSQVPIEECALATKLQNAGVKTSL